MAGIVIDMGVCSGVEWQGIRELDYEAWRLQWNAKLCINVMG
jgi:hypothetical protein